MKNVFVTSGGFNSINNYVSDENVELFKELSTGKKVIIIANAAPETSGNYIARENVKENFLKVGAAQADIVDIDVNNTGIILDYDIIYVLGGDLRYLIEINTKTDFKEKLMEFLKTGIYIGESAGSMILADNVKYAYDLKKGTKPKYDIELESYVGFNLIDLYIFPHFQKAKPEMIEKVNNYEKERNIKITRLNDGDIISYQI
jgi:peptidase E